MALWASSALGVRKLRPLGRPQRAGRGSGWPAHVRGGKTERAGRGWGWEARLKVGAGRGWQAPTSAPPPSPRVRAARAGGLREERNPRHRTWRHGRRARASGCTCWSWVTCGCHLPPLSLNTVTSKMVTHGLALPPPGAVVGTKAGGLNTGPSPAAQLPGEPSGGALRVCKGCEL